jgi:Protein of unknown function (DUF1569)
MKSIFDEGASAELIRRIDMLNENSHALWGKMTVYQMLKHCTLWEEMMAGDRKFKRMFLGRLFGKVILKKILKNERPMMKNARTVPGFSITGQGDSEMEKRKWIAMVGKHSVFSNPGFIHPFFGKMTKEQIGYLSYKHTDHHLRQFNC